MRAGMCVQAAVKVEQVHQVHTPGVMLGHAGDGQPASQPCQVCASKLEECSRHPLALR